MPACRFADAAVALLVAAGVCFSSALAMAQGSTEPKAPAELGAQPASLSSPPAAEAPALDQAYSSRLSDRLLKEEGKLNAKAREDRTALVVFYGMRKNVPAWTSAEGLTPVGQAVIAEFSRADEWGLDLAAFKLKGLPDAGGRFASSVDQANVEFEISSAILKYARHAHGGRAEPTALSRFIDRQLTYADPQRVIVEIASSDMPDAYLRSLHPKHPQFELLRQKYLALKRGEKPAVAAAAASKDAKTEKGKKADAPKPEKASLKKLLVNMEQWRWMPDDLGDYYITVNVPEFMLRIVKDGKVVHTERAIVGKPDKQTPIFSEGMAQVIFNPTWGVPDSIKRNEIYPSLVKGKMRILTRNNLKLRQNGKDVDPESVDWGTADIRKFQVVQPSGGENVLGVVKFRFPNKHDVYMHDTPTRKLFDATDRAYSHGCVRVREPEKFATLLLANDQGWNAARVASAIKSAQENQTVNLKQKVPVHLTYFTAVVGEDGKLKLFNDVYGHEHRIAMGMEGKAHLLPREKEEFVKVDVVGSLNEARETKPAIGHKQEWARKAFESN